MDKRHKQISVIKALLQGRTVEFDDYKCVMQENALCVQAENQTTGEEMLLNPEASFTWVLNAIDRMPDEDVTMLQASMALTEAKKSHKDFFNLSEQEIAEMEKRHQRECDEIARFHDKWMEQSESV